MMPDEDHIILSTSFPSDWDDDTECPVCGELFDGDVWEYTQGGDAWGGSAWYVCPSCENQTVTVNY